MLAQQFVGVLDGAFLPRAVGVAEIDGDPELAVYHSWLLNPSSWPVVRVSPGACRAAGDTALGFLGVDLGLQEHVGFALFCSEN